MANPYFPPKASRGDDYQVPASMRPNTTAAMPPGHAVAGGHGGSRVSFHDVSGAGAGAGAAGTQRNSYGQQHAGATDYARNSAHGPSSSRGGTLSAQRQQQDYAQSAYRDPYAASQAFAQANGPASYASQPIAPVYPHGPQSNVYRLSYTGQQQQRRQQQDPHSQALRNPFDSRPASAAASTSQMSLPMQQVGGYPPTGAAYQPHQPAYQAPPMQQQGSFYGADIGLVRPESPADGVYHPSLGRKLDRSKLTEEQRKIAEQFPEDLDEDGGSLWESMKGVFKNWRSYVAWKYTHYYILLILILALVALMTIFHRQIVDWLTPFSKKLQSIPVGWLIPVAILFVISFPPLFGHEIVAVLCGVVYGLWKGFGIVALGTLLGEVGNFYAFKSFLSGHAERYERKNINYACMAHIVREGGFFVVLLARLSAIPGHFTTAVFATVGMSIWVFILAAILSMPKQISIVYLGYVIEQSGDSAHEPTSSRIVKYLVLFISVVITVGAAWYLYGKMHECRPEVQARLKQKRFTMLSEARRTDNISISGPVSQDKLYQHGGDDDDLANGQTTPVGAYGTAPHLRYNQAGAQAPHARSGSGLLKAAGWGSRWGSGGQEPSPTKEAQAMLPSSPFSASRDDLAAHSDEGKYVYKYAESNSSHSHLHADDLGQPLSTASANGAHYPHEEDSYEHFGKRAMHDFGPSIGGPDHYATPPHADLEDPDRTLAVNHLDPLANRPVNPFQGPGIQEPLSARSSPPHYDAMHGPTPMSQPAASEQDYGADGHRQDPSHLSMHGYAQ